MHKSKIRILVVNDIPNFRLRIADALKSDSDLEISAPDTFSSIYSSLLFENYDLVILGNKLGFKDGHENLETGIDLIREVREQERDLPLIISSTNDVETIHQIKELGFKLATDIPFSVNNWERLSTDLPSIMREVKAEHFKSKLEVE